MRLPTFYEQNLIPNWGKIYIRASRKRMRIAALQYANGQVKHCDGLIESPQCFFRVLYGMFRRYWRLCDVE